MKNYYVSAKRLEELKEELHELKTVRRLEVAERLKRAKEYGDLSENAEYSEAREQQDAVESRIIELEDIIKNASIIKKSSSQEFVDLGCEVEVEVKDKIRSFTIVGSNEARPEEGFISNESPLGRAIIGKKIGDSAKVSTPSGEVTYKIIKIS
ncbi:MAG: transcription elongation factor GreA [Candidatus Colwellbacteria bacterium]|jgi:transcription elongation factor GreA|nr:transcription elongation factor GreA [Candidatus Colwellbacteria bacterium]MCK9497603.1 transcription elongation factor GreA [Candidatus Colwellbacteria bacterium]MDD3752413.1 transcription elongation factor GreA [Candidatus Colwellbacteria bacterium]MDD4818804.1 transcription elongation factor GreA [Candidatus Colwellbacteria bacterium]